MSLIFDILKRIYFRFVFCESNELRILLDCELLIVRFDRIDSRFRLLIVLEYSQTKFEIEMNHCVEFELTRFRSTVSS